MAKNPGSVKSTLPSLHMATLSLYLHIAEKRQGWCKLSDGFEGQSAATESGRKRQADVWHTDMWQAEKAFSVSWRFHAHDLITYQRPHLLTPSSWRLIFQHMDFGEAQSLCSWQGVKLELEKTLESPLDSKEIQPVHPKGDQSWVFIGRTDVEAETPILWLPHAKSWLIGKDPDAGRDWGQEEKGTTEDEMARWHHRLVGHESE